MSKEMMRSNPLRRAMAAAPTTPPAGPESTVRTGSRAAEARLVIPPLDCITKMRDWVGQSRRELRARCPRFSRYVLHHGLQVGVHHHRAGALVFAELRKNLVRNRERQAELFQSAGDSVLSRVTIFRG